MKWQIALALLVLIGLSFLASWCIALHDEKQTLIIKVKRLQSQLENAQKEVHALKVKYQQTKTELAAMRSFNKEKLYDIAIKNSSSNVPYSIIRIIVDTALHEPYSLMLLSIITVESHFNPLVISKSGARGCGQVSPKHWHDALVKQGIVKDLRDYHDPKKCVLAASYVFQTYLEKYNYNIVKTLQAYNCGETALRKNKSCGLDYAYRVLAKFGEYYWAKQ